MSDYGMGIASASVSATEDTAPVAAATAGLYTWGSAADRRKVTIFNSPSSPTNLYVRWNDTTVSPTGAAGKGWNGIVAPGGQYESPEILVKQVAIYIDVAATYGTHFSIEGWE
jgi:hypothetical protein